MKHTMRVVAGAAIAVAALGVGAGVAAASGGAEDDQSSAIQGRALDRAKAAALANTPGRVTGTEVGDEESYYEVEVTRADGSPVDVQLDRSFHVVGASADQEHDR